MFSHHPSHYPQRTFAIYLDEVLSYFTNRPAWLFCMFGTLRNSHCRQQLSYKSLMLSKALIKSLVSGAYL